MISKLMNAKDDDDIWYILFNRKDGDEHVATHTNKLILMTSYKMEKEENPHPNNVSPKLYFLLSLSINCLFRFFLQMITKGIIFAITQHLQRNTRTKHPFSIFHVFPCFFACKKISKLNRRKWCHFQFSIFISVFFFLVLDWILVKVPLKNIYFVRNLYFYQFNFTFSLFISVFQLPIKYWKTI